MVRQSIVFVTCALVLAGCDRAPSGGLLRTGAPAQLMADLVAPPPPGAQQFSYSHTWSVIMQRAAVSPRFLRARDRCLRDKTLNCKLVSANISSGGDGPYDGASATLQVQLPHDKLDGFEAAVLAPVKGEVAGEAAMASRSTQAQSVETQAGDAARKVASLTTYRDRLSDLAKRPNLSIDDIIKVESERMRVQVELDEAASQQRDLTSGIARESVTINLTERVRPEGPFDRVLNRAGETLGDSTASAILFLIAAVPWLPIVAAGIFLVSWLWRLFQRRRKANVAS